MENIIIDIKSEIEPIDGEKNKIEMETVGEFVNKNGIIYLIYYESELSGMQGCKTILKISDDNIVMSRYGDSTSKIIFNKLKTTESLYQTPYGNFKMEVKTLKLDVDINIDELTGRINLLYNMNLENLSSSINSLEIIIKKTLNDE